MSKGGEKDLWQLAAEVTKDKENSEMGNTEASILIAGSKSAGKTSIILRFLDRDETPKPTTALEYTFGRRAKGHNIAKDVGHIWELGGGTWLSKLIDIVISPDSIMNVTLVLVLDLSAPNELWFTLEKLLAAAKERIESVITEMKQSDPQIREKLREKAWERVGKDHPDKDMIDPFLIPLVLIGSKYDLYQEFDPEKRKVICKSLRFVAHSHGAHLQFYSSKTEALISRAKLLISHHVFATSPSKTVQTEHNKPLLVPPGMDALAHIGSPPLSDGDIGRVTASNRLYRRRSSNEGDLTKLLGMKHLLKRNPLELWKQAYTSFFPQENINNPAMMEDPAKDPQYAEAAVDSMRAQKDQELERYRRQCERKVREARMQEGYA